MWCRFGDIHSLKLVRPSKIGQNPKEKQSSNHQFSGAMVVSGRVASISWLYQHSWWHKFLHQFFHTTHIIIFAQTFYMTEYAHPRYTLAKPLWTRGGSDNTKRQTRKRLTDVDGQNLQLVLFRWRKITFLNELVVKWIFSLLSFFFRLFFWILSNVRPLFFQKRMMHLEATPLEAAEQPRTSCPSTSGGRSPQSLKFHRK